MASPDLRTKADPDLDPMTSRKNPKRQRQEDAPLIPKVEGAPAISSKNRFKHICKMLGEMQAEHRLRGELISKACLLAVYALLELPDRIRKMMLEQSRVEDSERLREENARFNLEVGSLINENRALRKQAEAAVAAAEKIRMFASQAGEVVVKAELFDEKVGIGSKPSRTRIALIPTNYLEKLESILVAMRVVVNQVTDLRRQPERQDLGASCSKGVPNLSNLLLPETFSGLPSMEDYTGVDVMPESKIAPGPKDSRKGRSPAKKNKDEIMTSASKGESESGNEDFSIPDLHQRHRTQSRSPDQETAGFRIPSLK
jgi:hypothetical protein